MTEGFRFHRALPDSIIINNNVNERSGWGVLFFHVKVPAILSCATILPRHQLKTSLRTYGGLPSNRRIKAWNLHRSSAPGIESIFTCHCWSKAPPARVRFTRTEYENRYGIATRMLQAFHRSYIRGLHTYRSSTEGPTGLLIDQKLAGVYGS